MKPIENTLLPTNKLPGKKPSCQAQYISLPDKPEYRASVRGAAVSDKPQNAHASDPAWLPFPQLGHSMSTALLNL
jgi:hypothetical protein